MLVSRSLAAVTAFVLSACTLDFDSSKIAGNDARPAADGSTAGTGGAAATLSTPRALWWFPQEGAPAAVVDQVKGGLGIDVFPVLTSDVGRGQVVNGVWVSARGVLRSDPGPATKLAAAIAKSQAISLEVWAEADASFEGNGNVFGCEFFRINQTRVGTETSLWVKGASKATPVTLLPSARLRHIVAAYSAKSGIQRLYLDATEAAKGDMRGAASSDSEIAVPNDEIRISIGDPSWVGSVHLAAIYDKELTPAEVRALFAAGPKRR